MAERKRSYKPGYRNKPDYDKEPGRFAEGRWAWVTVYFGQFVIWGDWKKDSKGNQTDEVKDIKLIHPVPNRQAVSWTLTACTEEELISMKHLFDTAFEWALPIVRQRDKEAQDAFEAGDDSHSRVYRQVPQLVYRSGPESKHGQSVQHGSENASGVLPDDGDSDGDVRGSGDEVDERDEAASSPKDNWPKVDQPPSLRKMGDVGD